MHTTADPHVWLPGATAEPGGVSPLAGPAHANGNGHGHNAHALRALGGSRVLVLNASYEPINVCNVRRATVHVLSSP